MPLPNAIFATASAMPPKRTVCAARTFPSAIALCKREYFSRTSCQSGIRFASFLISISATLEPAFLNSGEIAFRTSHGHIAKLTSVGGTSISLNEPDIESFPPIDAKPSRICASNAPSKAAKGLPHRDGLLRSFSKYSWKVKRILEISPPLAAIFATDSSTAYSAP